MGVTLIPFSTSLLAEFIKRPGAALAATIYSGRFIFVTIFFNALWHYALLGPLYYVIPLVLAVVSVPASVTGTLMLAVFVALPTLPSTRRGEKNSSFGPKVSPACLVQ